MPMLSFLVDALADAREQAGVSLADVAYAARDAGKARGKSVKVDAAYLSRLERGLSGWSPKIDDVVRGYAAATGVSDVDLWERALRAYGHEEAEAAIRSARARGRRRASE